MDQIHPQRTPTEGELYMPSPVRYRRHVGAAVVRKDYPQLHVEDLASEPGALLLDVRTEAEYAGGVIPGARNLPLDELRGRLGELPRDRRVVVYCQAGQRGYVATVLLRQAGFDAVNLSGGYRTYRMFQP